jgi:prepilin-type N-terminal cleavage/methylation domain-containing protein/prepilin-type processing-associated H-X9-DG protein
MNAKAPRRRRAFTLVELLIVVTIVGVLAGLVVPAVFEALHVAHRTACASNLRQLGIAVSLYLKDNHGLFFPIRMPNDPKTPEDEGKLWYFGCETGTSWSGTAEGQRVLDTSRARLFPYTDDYEGIEICPAFDYFGSYKAKFRGKWWTYGINKVLSPDLYASRAEPCRNITEIRACDASRTIVMADAAQVNTFQPPASPDHPMLEEFYYVNTTEATVHFRHRQTADAVFCDGHVARAGPVAGSLDLRLPGQVIGRVPAEMLVVP